MTDPEQQHTEEPAEGAVQPGKEPGGGRTPHPEQPAEGDRDTTGGGADTPTNA
jgi:hypothetical protein